MESVSDVIDTFQSIVQQASGVPLAILADQGREAPSGLYATYNPVVVRAVGHPRKSRSDSPPHEPTDLTGWTDFDEAVVSQMDLMLSCNFFNEGARDAAWRMHNANFRYSLQSYLHENSIAWRYCGEVKNLTSVLQAGLQPRFHVDCMLYIEGEVSGAVLRAAGVSIVLTDVDGNQF